MIKVLKAYSFHQPTEENYFPQNLLVRQFKFPSVYSEEDRLLQIYTTGWSDEEYKKFWHVTELTWKRNELSEQQLKKFLPDLEIRLLDQQLEDLSEDQFFNLGQFTAAELDFSQQSQGVYLTGFRVVRYTDRTTTAPYYRFDFYYTPEAENRKLYSGYSGENTTFWHKQMLW